MMSSWQSMTSSCPTCALCRSDGSLRSLYDRLSNWSRFLCMPSSKRRKTRKILFWDICSQWLFESCSATANQKKTHYLGLVVGTMIGTRKHKEKHFPSLVLVTMSFFKAVFRLVPFWSLDLCFTCNGIISTSWRIDHRLPQLFPLRIHKRYINAALPWESALNWL